MIALHRLHRGELHRLAGLRLAPGQEGFVGSGAEMIRDRTEGLLFYEVRDTASGAAVGMFKLDPLYWQRNPHAGPQDVGLRGVLVDASAQGRGIGRAMLAQLPDAVRAAFPGARRVVLTVNVDNPRARRAYLAAGFRDAGELYLGGRNGPQHILRLDLCDGPVPPAS